MRPVPIFIIGVFLLSSFICKSQTIDTLMDVGGYKLQFIIIKGTGIPLLFEAGAGNDGSVWNDILPALSKEILNNNHLGLSEGEMNTWGVSTFK